MEHVCWQLNQIKKKKMGRKTYLFPPHERFYVTFINIITISLGQMTIDRYRGLVCAVIFFQCGHLFKCQTDRRGWKYEIRRLTQQREKPYLFCLFTSTVLFKWGSFIFYESRWKLSEVLKLELRYKPKMCSLIHDTVTFNTATAAAAAAVFINVQRSWSSRSCVHVRAHLMGPSQHNCHFAPLLQVLHTGELAALTDASS